PDILERREPFRPAHLALVRECFEAGSLRMAGAYGDPVRGAVIIFTSQEAAADFVIRDPYVLNGLVTAHRVEPWNVVIGA
ncbi:YciI family protein, partial [Tepidiforma sp.]|uniref:YciI family protein n=1 Tax=Tepidiforma sp. TaxID=2682230 RepID=UPI002ADDB3E9